MGIKVKSFGEEAEIRFKTAKYSADNSLAVEAWCDDGPYARLTVCLDDKGLVENDSYFDCENCGELYEQMKEIGLFEDIGIYKHSGWVDFPLVRWNMKMIEDNKL